MKAKENIFKIIFLMTAGFSILAVILICFFLFTNGIPAMNKIGLTEFISGKKWKPGNDLYGILPMILGSIYVTAGAVLIGGPVGLMTAVFLAKFCPPKLHKIIKPAVDLMAGIPSVVYGFFGLMTLVPLIRDISGGSGSSMLCAIVLLGIMILPVIISVSESALNAVPASYYEGARALGASHENAVFFTLLPAAKNGIFAGIILGTGRAIGETMAVVMVAGNQARMPKGLTKGIRTLTSNIVIEMGYAAELHRDALIATGVVLFVFILLINLSFNLIRNRGKL
ncbi:phosphate ABC transporter permease subunit PstC [Treponema sp.]|uniref:phosphate ABC transporter permease subunit PstC n=1 Tax=Treponema sp. TaxID=166 RepID=UPI0025E7CFD9|nr:phosphate ABC transporter permease subunit PstC [Treponema sp.]MCR5217084.1 phosphate ABC transporter permease subunit PstC [Treponema sp.]